MIRELKLSDRTIIYELNIKNVKNINLRIKPDGKIYVSANATVDIDKIDSFILSKEKFVLGALKKCEELKKYKSAPKEYVDGETFLLFGHEMRLKVIMSQKRYIECDESYIYLYIKENDSTEIKQKIINKWLRSECRKTISIICEAVYPKFKKYDIEFPGLKYRNMISRWGSCQPKKSILTFNYALINAPISCVEYVVVHEFVHFLVANHSRKFYEQISVFLPDWQERRELLKKIVPNVI